MGIRHGGEECLTKIKRGLFNGHYGSRTALFYTTVDYDRYLLLYAWNSYVSTRSRDILHTQDIDGILFRNSFLSRLFATRVIDSEAATAS